MNKYALTGASFPMMIAGKEFAACTLIDKDYQEIDGYIQSKVMEVARSQLDGLTGTERQEMLGAAIKAAAATGWGTPEGHRIINTTEGSLRLGWQMLKKKQPNLSFSAFSELAHKDLVPCLLEIDKCFVVLNTDSEEEGAPEASSEEPKS